MSDMTLLDLAKRVEDGDDSYELWASIIDACDMPTPCSDPLRSLDSAMSLVPASVLGWRADWNGRRTIVRMGFDCIPSIVEGAAETPARAITAAALRARHALAISKGSDV